MCDSKHTQAGNGANWRTGGCCASLPAKDTRGKEDFQTAGTLLPRGTTKLNTAAQLNHYSLNHRCSDPCFNSMERRIYLEVKLKNNCCPTEAKYVCVCVCCTPTKKTPRAAIQFREARLMAAASAKQQASSAVTCGHWHWLLHCCTPLRQKISDHRG